MRTLLFMLVIIALAGVAMADVNVTGKWTGNFTMTRPNGEANDTTAVLMLKQTGNEITGTVGPNEDEQFTIQKGAIDGNKIAIEVDHNGHTIKFDLVLADDRITGEANMTGDGGETAKAKLDVSRAK